MKRFRVFSVFALSCTALVALTGCSSPVTPEEQAEHPPTLLKRAINQGTNIEVDSNINQINQTLSMVKADNDGKPPADLAAAKVAAKGITAEMWVDSVSGKDLLYDPVSGTVHREGTNPNTPSAAGSSHGNFNLPSGSGGF